jgi:hypothetical protein
VHSNSLSVSPSLNPSNSLSVSPSLTVAGIWYLLCLPGGYLFLIIYSFCNLDDRSWGTREEASKKAAGGSSSTSELFLGCGRHPGVSGVYI